LNPVTDLSFAHASVTCTTPTTTVTLSATNGVGALQYETIAPSASIIGTQASNSFAGLTAGNYTFKVTDANGCFYTESYTISPVTPIVVVGNKTSDVLCKGGSTGSITFAVSGNASVGAYTYVLTTGTGTITKTGNSLSLPNLVAGSYTVTVTDTATGCTANSTVLITEPASTLSLSATATNTSCSNHNSNITVTPAGGTSPYTYAGVKSGSAAPLSGVYQASNIVSVNTNLGSDLIWDVYVKDANGCIVSSSKTIVRDNVPTVSVPSIASNQCIVASGFTFTATGLGGVAPLSYSIDATSFQASASFSNCKRRQWLYGYKPNGYCCIATING
jgi:uncharacterized protein (DUF2141 family)